LAPKKKPYSQLSDSAKYFRKNKKARDRKNAISKKVNARPEQRKKRSELEKKRRAAKKRGVDTSKTDLSHTKNGLVRKSIKANRGSSSDTKGDRNARGKGSSKK